MLRAAGGLSAGDDRRAGLAEQPRGLRSRTRNVDRVRIAERNWFERTAGRSGLAPRRSGGWAGRLRGGRLRPRHRRPRRRAIVVGARPRRRRATGRLGDGRRRVPSHRRRRMDRPDGTRSDRGWPCSNRWGSSPTRRPEPRSTFRTKTGCSSPPSCRRPGRDGPRPVDAHEAMVRTTAGPRTRRRPGTGSTTGRHGQLPIDEAPTGCTPSDSIPSRRCWPSIWAPAPRRSDGPTTTGRRWSSGSWRTAGGSRSSAGRKTLRSRAALASRTAASIGRAGSASPRRRLCLNGPTYSSAPIPAPPAPGGLGRDALGRPLQRHQQPAAMAALVEALRSSCEARLLRALPPENLPAGRTPLHGRPRSRPRLPRLTAVVGADAVRDVPVQPRLKDARP